MRFLHNFVSFFDSVAFPKRRPLKFYLAVGALGLTMQYMGFTGGILQLCRYCATGIGQVGKLEMNNLIQINTRFI